MQLKRIITKKIWFSKNKIIPTLKEYNFKYFSYLVEAPFVFGEELSLFLFEITSNSSKSVELWLAGDQGSCGFTEFALTEGKATCVLQGSVLSTALVGAQGSASEGACSCGGEESEEGFQGEVCYRKMPYLI